MHSSIESEKAPDHAPRFIFATLSTADSYTNALRILLDSLQLNLETAINIEIACLGWKPDLIEDFRERYPDFSFRGVHFSSRRLEERAIRWKTHFVARLLEESPENSVVIFSDADHVALRGLMGLFETMSNFDIGLRYRPEHRRQHLRFAAGLFGVKNSELGRNALLYWRRLVRKHATDWWADQVALPEVASYCESIGARVWKMGDDSLSIDSGNRDAYLWCRSECDLDLDERVSQNRQLLESRRLK